MEQITANDPADEKSAAIDNAVADAATDALLEIAEKERDDAIARASDAEAKVETLTAMVDDMAKQIADLMAKLDTAQKAASVTAAKRSGGTRKIGPVGSSKAPILGGSALLREIENAESVEIGFSDGKHEIAGLQPVAISGDAWRMSGDRVQLNVPELILHGPAHGVPAFKLAGYGLFLDGKLVAYSDRGGVFPIETGHRVNLKDDVIF